MTFPRTIVNGAILAEHRKARLSPTGRSELRLVDRAVLNLPALLPPRPPHASHPRPAVLRRRTLRAAPDAFDAFDALDLGRAPATRLRPRRPHLPALRRPPATSRASHARLTTRPAELGRPLDGSNRSGEALPCTRRRPPTAEVIRLEFPSASHQERPARAQQPGLRRHGAIDKSRMCGRKTETESLFCEAPQIVRCDLVRCDLRCCRSWVAPEVWALEVHRNERGAEIPVRR
jgi:hypothetical protein